MEKEINVIRPRISIQKKWLKWESIFWSNFHVNGDDLFGFEIFYWLKIENLNFDVSDTVRSRVLDKIELFGRRWPRFISDTCKYKSKPLTVKMNLPSMPLENERRK